MNEDFVSFEQALKLKELGFDWKCTHFYESDNEVLMPLEEIVSAIEGHDFRISSDEFVEDFNKQQDICSAPTLSQAQKWLREVKDIIIGIDFNNWYDKYECHLYQRMGYNGVNIRNTYGSRLVSNEFHGDFDTYEQALSKGLDKALELLKEE